MIKLSFWNDGLGKVAGVDIAKEGPTTNGDVAFQEVNIVDPIEHRACSTTVFVLRSICLEATSYRRSI